MKRLGKGRAAQVFLDFDARAQPFARKVFTGGALSNLVLLLLTGSRNPYMWCEWAVRTACARRWILSPLVKYWFGDKLRLPATLGWDWNRDLRAYELRVELIDGCHAPLEHPGRPHDADTLADLVHGVMKPLQRHLLEAGFDGLVWQAGLGNPVAANNFLLESVGESPRWVWVDLESGVPALFALNPVATLRFYLPKSLHHRRWLFDDVDVPKLRLYLEEHRERMALVLGREPWPEICRQVVELERSQNAWKATAGERTACAEERACPQADPAVFVGSARAFAAELRRELGSVRWAHGLHLLWDFSTSQARRAEMSRRWVTGRIASWRGRRCLDAKTAEQLARELRQDDISSFASDFGVHMSLQLVLRLGRWFLLPALLAAGLLGPGMAGVVLFSCGIVARTLYTSGRLLQAVARNQRRPWVALWVGALPVVGNLAYPAQLAACSAEETGLLARFILSDALASIGRAVPIWGGEGSLLEHSLCRVARLLPRLRRAARGEFRRHQDTA